MTKVDVLGVKFDRQTMAEFMTTFTTRIAKHQGTFVVTANPEIVMFARKIRPLLNYLLTRQISLRPTVSGWSGAQQCSIPPYQNA